MNKNNPSLTFCTTGGCTAKLGAAVLEKILPMLPKKEDKNLLVGFGSSDDAAVYRLSDNMALVQTLDFFPPMVEDPYTFGQIAAANAMSDIFAMGAEVKTALNIVCFPETEDMNILGAILQGGNEKVMEAGGVLAGGHSIMDETVKYGLSVTGIVHPDRIYRNNSCCIGDKLILTKPLGTGIICSASRAGQADPAAMEKAVESMTTLNKKASQIMKRYRVHGSTDVTGFGLAVHLNEMLDNKYSALLYSDKIPFFDAAYKYAGEFLITAAGQRNRSFMEGKISFRRKDFALEEIVFDPQTSGGLLISAEPVSAEKCAAKMIENGIDAHIIGEITERRDIDIKVI